MTGTVRRFSYGLSTYDNFIRYFSKILPEDTVKNYIKENKYFLIADGDVYLLDMTDQIEPRLLIDYGSMKITKEEDGLITVSAMIGDAWDPEREVTFELVKTDDGYRIVGGTFISEYLTTI